MAETTRTTLITDEDLDSLDTLRPEGDKFVLDASDLHVLAVRLRARWVAEALEGAASAIAERCGHEDYRDRGTGDGSFEDRWHEPKIWPADLCPFCSKDTELVRGLAAEYRDGRR